MGQLPGGYVGSGSITCKVSLPNLALERWGGETAISLNLAHQKQSFGKQTAQSTMVLDTLGTGPGEGFSSNDQKNQLWPPTLESKCFAYSAR
jgi:hypothetical protein